MEQAAQVEFCATIMSAAHKMGIGLREFRLRTNGGGPDRYQYDWVEPFDGQIIFGAEHEDRQTALELACHRLVDYLKIEPTKTNEAPSNRKENPDTPNQAAG